jgi:hypothetical protein
MPCDGEMCVHLIESTTTAGPKVRLDKGIAFISSLRYMERICIPTVPN